MSNANESPKVAAGQWQGFAALRKGLKARIYTGFLITVAAFLILGGDALYEAGGAPSTSEGGHMLSWVLLLGAAILGLGLAFWTTRAVSRSFEGLASAARGLADEQHVDIPYLEEDSELGELARSLSQIQSRSDDVQRIKIALDGCQTNVMVADNDLNIVYMNETMVAMMKNAESDLKADLPNLDANDLMGKCVDIFHKNPAHQRGMIKSLSSAHNTSIEVGGRTFNLIASPVVDASGNRLGTVVEWDDVTAKLAEEREQQRIAAENLRTKIALDGCQTNVMIADTDLNIVYMNETMVEMMKNAESDLQKDLPDLRANGLMGQCVDVFHKNPAHQRGMIEKLNETYRTSIEVGGRTFNLIASPVTNPEGQRLGTVVEWDDVTEKLAEEREQQRIAAENLRTKIALDGCQTNVMVADTDLNIVYMNETMVEMMKNAENDLRKDLPNLRADDLMGKCVDIFHKNPAHQRGMIEKLSEAFRTSIEVGGRTFNLIASPVIDSDGQRLGTVVEWDDVTEKLAEERELQRIAAENLRIKIALDGCQTNVMVADDNYDIVYMNHTMTEMMKAGEADIRTQLPQFDASKLIGISIDRFHANPDHQRRMLEQLSSTHKTELKVGGRTFALSVSPVRDEDQNRIGTVVEWNDLTMERAVETELNTVVQAAAAGDFSQRVELEGKSGFMLNMAESINMISETCDRGLSDVGRMLQALAKGDLTQRVTAEYQGTFAQIKDDANETSERLSEIVSEITGSATEVSNAAGEITAGSADLSQRTEQQASSLEETAASMEEMAATVKTNAENAEQANQLGISAREVATDGGEVVGEAVTAMAKIEESSQKISDIIGVIDEIAFQTNLLALNAAVEAARAGEAGKGFAVVASEVRTLAQRSSEAAKDIKALILDSGNQVKDGVQLVNKAGETLNEIVESIKRVTDIISEIAAASKEQASGVEEINSAVTEMDEMTQQNSALVEENAAAAKTLEEQSVAMNDRMSFFNIAGQQRSGSVAQQQARVSQAAPSIPAAKAPAKPAAAPAPKKVASGGGGDDDWAEF